MFYSQYSGKREKPKSREQGQQVEPDSHMTKITSVNMELQSFQRPEVRPPTPEAKDGQGWSRSENFKHQCHQSAQGSFAPMKQKSWRSKTSYLGINNP